MIGRPFRTDPAVGRAERVGRELRRAIFHLAQGHGELIEHAERSWASITFSGTRHTIVLAFDGAEAVEAAEQMIGELPEHTFDIPGQLVADAETSEVDHRADPPRLVATLDVLLLEDAPLEEARERGLRRRPGPAPTPPVDNARPPQRANRFTCGCNEPPPLLQHVNAFLRLTGLPPTKFGRLATHDPRFVLDLRAGRHPRKRTVERVEHFMASYTEESSAS